MQQRGVGDPLDLRRPAGRASSRRRARGARPLRSARACSCRAPRSRRRAPARRRASRAAACSSASSRSTSALATATRPLPVRLASISARSACSSRPSASSRLVPVGDADRAGATCPPIASRQRSATCARRRLVGAGEQQHELVAAVAGDLVVRAQLAAAARRRRWRSSSSPACVAARVVDALEVVEVEDHAAERGAVAARAGDLLADADLHRAVVEQRRSARRCGRRAGRARRPRRCGRRRWRGRRSPRASAGPRRRAAARRVQPTDSAPRSSSFHAIGHGERGLELAHHRVAGPCHVALIVVVTNVSPLSSDLAGGALAGRDVQAVPARRARCSRRWRPPPSLAVAEVDAGHVGAERRARPRARACAGPPAGRATRSARGRRARRAVLGRAGGAAALGLEAGEAGGGRVGEQPARRRPSAGVNSRARLGRSGSRRGGRRRPQRAGRTAPRRRRSARRSSARIRCRCARRGRRAARRVATTRAIPDGPSPQHAVS